MDFSCHAFMVTYAVMGGADSVAYYTQRKKDIYSLWTIRIPFQI
jgi:hypothetical protein